MGAMVCVCVFSSSQLAHDHGEQCHANIHATLGLAEVGRTWIGVKVGPGRQEKWAKLENANNWIKGAQLTKSH